METKEKNKGIINVATKLPKAFKRDVLKKQVYSMPGFWKRSRIRHVCIAMKSPACSRYSSAIW